MTTLICSGTLFSDWQQTLEQLMLAGSKCLPVYQKLSALSADICRQHFPETNELLWQPFSPDEKYLDTANRLLSSIANEPVFAWADTNSSLFLNLWRAAGDDAKVILFYSSPEHELANYINKHSFDVKVIENVITAWANRAQAMLTFFLNHRSDSLLINVQSAGSEGRLFVRMLNEKFDLNLECDSLVPDGQYENSALVEFLATTLLLNNETVSEIYDEVRSATTVICEQDKSMTDIPDREKSLIAAFLDEVKSLKQLTQSHRELEDELSLNQLQIHQLQEELEYYFILSQERESITKTFASYLATDALLKVARQARVMR